MKSDLFGDRMKDYEKEYTSARVPGDQYLCVRIDGKRFSKFTKGFEKPFDDRISNAFLETTRALVKDTHATIGFFQSDEITLIFAPKGNEHIFGGKVSKVNSVLASMATAHFNHFIQKYAPITVAGKGYAYFDCRAWAVPSSMEAFNVLLWRAQDARKNSISALFRWTLGAKKMMNLDQKQMKATLLAEAPYTDWEALPARWKYGTYIKPVSRETKLTVEQLMQIPEKKRPGIHTKVTRTFIEIMALGYIGDLDIDEKMDLVK